MCLGIPGMIISIEGSNAKVTVAGAKKDCSLRLLPDAKVGEFVIVHAGFAIERIDREKAEETLRLIEGLAGRRA
jgi:hydrogenase expression/formation protein HypC